MTSAAACVRRSRDSAHWLVARADSSEPLLLPRQRLPYEAFVTLDQPKASTPTQTAAGPELAPHHHSEPPVADAIAPGPERVDAAAREGAPGTPEHRHCAGTRSLILQLTAAAASDRECERVSEGAHEGSSCSGRG